MSELPMAAGWQQMTNPPMEVVFIALMSRGSIYPVPHLWVAQYKTGAAKGYFTSPGGKRECNESPRQCGLRELREETGIVLQATDLAYQGARDFNFLGHGLRYNLFLGFADQDMVPQDNEPDRHTPWELLSTDMLRKRACTPGLNWALDIVTPLAAEAPAIMGGRRAEARP